MWQWENRFICSCGFTFHFTALGLSLLLLWNKEVVSAQCESLNQAASANIVQIILIKTSLPISSVENKKL